MDAKQQNRYSRQILFANIGEAGQQRLLDSSAVLVGCGAIGTAVANLLIRAGLGSLRIIDRDFVEPSNLQRQTLFEESDAQENLPKAVAAERRLRAINSEAKIEAVVADLTPQNARALLENFPVILDGTDNFETRLLINDASIALNIPWIYAAAVASSAVTMTILPGETPCLACLVESNEPATEAAPHMEETCDTAGILNAAIHAIAAIESTEAIKLLIGQREALHQRLISLDVWTNQNRSIRVARNPQLPRLRPKKFPLSRRRRPTAHHPMRPRQRPNPRARPKSRSRRVASSRSQNRHRSPQQQLSSPLPSKFLRPNRLPRRPRHNQRHKRPSRSPHPLRPLHRVRLLLCWHPTSTNETYAHIHAGK